MEVSSFQLETIDRFHPWVAAILNVTVDHQDRYDSIEEYLAAKQRIFENQTSADFALFNWTIPAWQRFGVESGPNVSGLRGHRRSASDLDGGTYLEGDRIVTTVTGLRQEICRRGELKIIGHHNVENVMAAATYAALCGCPLDVDPSRGRRHFPGLEHALGNGPGTPWGPFRERFEGDECRCHA